MDYHLMGYYMGYGNSHSLRGLPSPWISPWPKQGFSMESAHENHRQTYCGWTSHPAPVTNVTIGIPMKHCKCHGIFFADFAHLPTGDSDFATIHSRSFIGPATENS